MLKVWVGAFCATDLLAAWACDKLLRRLRMLPALAGFARSWACTVTMLASAVDASAALAVLPRSLSIKVRALVRLTTGVGWTSKMVSIESWCSSTSGPLRSCSTCLVPSQDWREPATSEWIERKMLERRLAAAVSCAGSSYLSKARCTSVAGSMTFWRTKVWLLAVAIWSAC